ncbi:MAG: arsenate reductase [Pseudomonadota bacterium]|jgi:arsenate reductase
MPLTIYYNPKCSTARNVLQGLRDAGHEPTIVDYLKTPLDADALRQLAGKLPQPHDLLRSKEPLYKTLQLHPEASLDSIVEAVAAHPILLNRPICSTDSFAMAVRPSAAVATFLEHIAP